MWDDTLPQRRSGDVEGGGYGGVTIVWLIIGAIFGWAAGQIMKGYGFGVVGNESLLRLEIAICWKIRFFGYFARGSSLAGFQ